MLQEDDLKNNQKRTGYFCEKFKNFLERLFCSEHLKLKLYDHHATGLYSRRNEIIYITEKIILYQNLYHIKCYRKLGTSVIPLN